MDGHLTPVNARADMRAALVRVRASLIETARALAESVGQRLPPCDADTIDAAWLAGLPEEIEQVLTPLVEEVVSLTEKIKAIKE